MSDPSPSTQIAASDARRAARNVGVLVLSSILSKGLLFVWQIVLGTLLGPSDYGVYNTVLGLFALAAIVTSFSMGPIVIREVAAAPEKAGRYASIMLVTQTSLSALAYLGMVLGALLIGSPSVLVFSAIAGISLIVELFGTIGYELLIAQEEMVITSVIDILHIVVRIGLAALALAAGYGLLGLYAATIASGLLRSVLFWAVHWRRGLRPQWPVQRDWMLRLLVDASPLLMTAFLNLAYTHADKLMTTALLGETKTGYLGPAFLIIFGVIELLSTTLLVAMYPLLSRYYGDGKNETFGYLVEALSRFLLMVALPIVLALSIFSHDIIAFIYRSGEYSATGGILRILAWYTLFAMAANPMTKALLIQNRQRWLLAITVGSLALNITLNTILLLQYRDPRGAALATVCAELLSLTLKALLFRAKGFDWARVVGKSARVLLAGGLAAAAMLLLGSLNWVLGGVVGGLLYLLALPLLGALSDEDWDLLYRLLAAMPGGTLIRRYWRRDTAVNW